MTSKNEDKKIDVRDRCEEAAYAVYDQETEEWTTSDGGPGPAPKAKIEETKPE